MLSVRQNVSINIIHIGLYKENLIKNMNHLFLAYQISLPIFIFFQKAQQITANISDVFILDKGYAYK